MWTVGLAALIVQRCKSTHALTIFIKLKSSHQWIFTQLSFPVVILPIWAGLQTLALLAIIPWKEEGLITFLKGVSDGKCRHVHRSKEHWKLTIYHGRMPEGITSEWWRHKWHIINFLPRERERVINNTPVNGLLFWNKQIEGSCLLISRILLAFQGSFCCCFFQRNTAFQSFTLSTNNNKAGFWNILRSRRLRIGATVLPFHPLVTSSMVWSQICLLVAESLVKLPSSFPRIQGSQTPQKVK